LILRALEGIAGRATWLMAGALVVGYAFPPLAATFRPLILYTIVVILAVAMIRLDVDRLRAYARRPVVLAVVVFVNLVATPVFVWLIVRPLGLPDGLEQGLVLLAAAPMVSSAIAIAAILGLDTALTVAVMVGSYAVVPLTLPALALWLLGMDIGVGFLELFLRLFGTVAVPAAIAVVVRKWLASPATLARYGRTIDGVGVLFIVAFCLGIVSGLPDFVNARPDYVVMTLYATFAANIGLQVLGTVLFLRLGRREALTIGLVTGNTNLGLVMVTLADRASEDLIAVFVLGQVPMYFLPVIALPLYRRLLRDRDP
jgi:BASS family bile acid:Na+ symporter